MPVRIGFVIGQLSVGGAEGQLYELLRHLDERFSPVVFCLTAQAGSMREDLARLGVPVHNVGRRGLPRARRLRRLIVEQGIDLVHSWLFIANGYAAAATLFGRQPLITSARNCKVQGRASQLVNAIAFRCSSAIVVNSNDVEEYIVRHYAAPRDRIQMIVNGVDTQRFCPLAQSSGVAEVASPPRIVTIGRLVQQKNQALFLEAGSRLAKAYPELELMIVGEGPLRAQLQRQAQELGLSERVSFAGERRDTDAILRQASLFWLTSRWEGMPNTVLEALASGVPVIATDVGGTRQILRDGVDGYVVPSGDAGAFVSRSTELLGDRPRREQFAHNARQRAEEFSPQRMAEKFEELYDDILDARRLGRA